MNGKQSNGLAYERIKDLILNMEIKPGETVTEISVSERLKLGRTPVREALKKLEQEGLVITRNRRKRVHILTVSDLEEIFDIKVRLETFVVSKASEQGTKKQRDQLARVMNEMCTIAYSDKSKSDSSGQLDAWLKKDQELHHQLYAMADNSKLEHILSSIDLQWQRLRLGMYTLEGRMVRSCEEHRQVVQHVIDKNPEGASTAMKKHIENVRDELVKLFKIFHYPSN